MKKTGTNQNGFKCPNNRAFRSFCPHLSPLETKRKGVREIRTPYGIVSSGDKRGQIVLNALFIGISGYFQFVPRYSICPRPGTNSRDCPLYGATASLYICPHLSPYPCFVPFVCPHIRVLSPLFVPIYVFCPRRGQILSPRLSWGQNRLSPCPVRLFPLATPVQKNR